MIAKLPKKDIIALIYITVLTMIALWYGFTSVPSPQQQRDMSYDQTRMNNINAIQGAIDNYYAENTSLPTLLDDLKDDSSLSPEELIDPQTKQPYEYAITSETEYNVCTTFATDSSEQNDPSSNAYYSTYDQHNHPQGYYCFTKTVIPKNILPPIWNPNDDTYIPLGSDSAQPSGNPNGVG